MNFRSIFIVAIDYKPLEQTYILYNHISTVYLLFIFTMFCLECELVVKHFLANFLYILLYLGCDTDILLIHYNAE